MLRLLGSDVVLDSSFFFCCYDFYYHFFARSNDLKSALLYFLCELCFLDVRTNMVPVGVRGEVLDAAVALKTGCVCFVFCLFVSSETAELHIPLLSVPRCLIPPNVHPEGSVSPPSLRCTNAIKTDTNDNAAPFKLRGFVCMPSGELKYGIKTCKMNAWLYPFPKKIKYKTDYLRLTVCVLLHVILCR